jgi:glycosyltransferase involved in cell wall biosynthesis
MKVFPIVSVLMPVYNGEKYLNQAIDSILNQTYQNFEFLLINDGSTDTSRAIILNYSDARIRYLENEKTLV